MKGKLTAGMSAEKKAKFVNDWERSALVRERLSDVYNALYEESVRAILADDATDVDSLRGEARAYKKVVDFLL